MSQTLLEMAKDLVLAQIEVHKLSPDEMQTALQLTHTSLLALQTLEAAADGSTSSEPPGTPAEAIHWRKSITKYHVMCLECGASNKQLSVRHLKEHNLDGKSYRIKYGIPRTQALSAKETTARRQAIVQQSKPWEKAPTYMKAQEQAEEAMTQEIQKAPKKRTTQAKT
jgi:predicted transcriptional regulator